MADEKPASDNIKPVTSTSPGEVSQGFFDPEKDTVNIGTSSSHNDLTDALLDPGADDSAKFLLENEGKFEPLTPEEEKKCIRKTDWFILPMLFWTATLGAVDKVSLSTAAIFGLETDTNLVGQQYSWLSSILFIGSLVGMWPMSYLVQRYPAGKVISTASLVWSCFTLLQCACTSFGGLAALRFLMGCAECVIVPGCSLMISTFYLKSESPHRTAIIFAFGSSVINGALSSLASTFGNAIPTWKYIYILVGSISFVWSCCMIYFLPNSPLNAKFLTTREKLFMVKRIVTQNRTGISNSKFKVYQAKESFLDPRTYLVMLICFSINITNGGLSTFNSIIIKNLNFTSIESSLMGMPTGVIATLATVAATWTAARWKNRRCLVAIIFLIVPLIGSVVCYASAHSNTAAQLVGLYLMYFYFAPYIVMISCVQANTAGNTKKAVTYGFNYLGYCGGAITGTQTFRSNDAPKYNVGFASLLIGYCACIVFCALYWVTCVVMNRRKTAPASDGKPVMEEALEEEEILDLTDFEQKHFLYTT